MNKLIVSLLLTVGISGIAHAAGDAAAGQAKAAVCGACHGPDGNSMAPNFPKLAGQGERYLDKQLHDIKSGKRQVLEMTGLLTNLSDQDLADIAAYFSSQKGSVGAADPKLVARGEAVPWRQPGKRHARLHRLPLAQRRRQRRRRLPAPGRPARSIRRQAAD
jgi:cytochrome c553